MCWAETFSRRVPERRKSVKSPHHQVSRVSEHLIRTLVYWGFGYITLLETSGGLDTLMYQIQTGTHWGVKSEGLTSLPGVKDIGEFDTITHYFTWGFGCTNMWTSDRDTPQRCKSLRSHQVSRISEHLMRVCCPSGCRICLNDAMIVNLVMQDKMK